jgi:hypothetical protein
MVGGNYEDAVISGYTASLVDGVLQCVFRQKIRVPDNVATGSKNRVYDLDESNYYLLLASGPYNETTNTVSFHYEVPVMTEAAVYLPSIISGNLPISLISKNGCGYAKGCLTTPAGCDPSVDCTKVVTYSIVNGTDTVLFELSSRNPGNDDYYAAVGFSVTGSMANTSVSACTVGDGNINVSMWFNPPGGRGHNRPQRINFLSNETTLVQLQEAAVINDVLTCRFLQKINIPSEDKAESSMLAPLNAPYHLLLARGNYTVATQSIQFHTEIPLVSDIVNVVGVRTA